MLPKCSASCKQSEACATCIFHKSNQQNVQFQLIQFTSISILFIESPLFSLSDEILLFSGNIYTNGLARGGGVGVGGNEGEGSS